MDSLFSIAKSGTYGVIITGLEKDNNEYLSETAPITVSTRAYAYSQTVTINTLSSISSSGVQTFITSSVNNHCTTCMDSNTFTLTKDGLYLVSHIILPTRAWFDYAEGLTPGNYLNYSTVYYYNETDGLYYKYVNGVHTSIALSELLAADYVTPTVGNKGTTIIRSDKNTFIMYFLMECFNNICKELLSALPYPCNTSTDFKSRVQDRDIIWMGINVINYEISLSQLYDAQRFLEELTWCGICNKTSSLTNNYTSCGCNN